jgi:hypothetical protein
MGTLLSVTHFDRAWFAEFGKEAIYSIVSRGRTAVLECLLAFNSIDRKMCVGMYPVSSSLLHIAAMKGQTSVADVLLGCETLNVNSTNLQNYNALHSAAVFGSVGVLKTLLRHPDVNVNQTIGNSRQTTALHLASRYNQVAIVEAVLRHKDIALNRTDSTGQRALRIAVLCGAFGAAELLMAHPNYHADDQNPRRTSLLQLASQRGHINMVLLLLKHENTSLEDTRNRKYPLLREALWNLQWPLVEFLVTYVGELSRPKGNTIFEPTGTSNLTVLEMLLLS